MVAVRLVVAAVAADALVQVGRSLRPPRMTFALDGAGTLVAITASKALRWTIGAS